MNHWSQSSPMVRQRFMDDILHLMKAQNIVESLYLLHRASYNNLFICPIQIHIYNVLSSYQIKFLYMFRAGSPIIRRFKYILYTQLLVFPLQYVVVVIVGNGRIPFPTVTTTTYQRGKTSQLRVQYIFEPPDDGRASPKHVEEFYLIGRQNIIYVYLSWTNKEINKPVINCCIQLVDSFECVKMHGPTNPKVMEIIHITCIVQEIQTQEIESIFLNHAVYF